MKQKAKQIKMQTIDEREKAYTEILNELKKITALEIINRELDPVDLLSISTLFHG